jgi:hypothetical protein
VFISGKVFLFHLSSLVRLVLRRVPDESCPFP